MLQFCDVANNIRIIHVHSRLTSHTTLLIRISLTKEADRKKYDELIDPCLVPGHRTACSPRPITEQDRAAQPMGSKHGGHVIRSDPVEGF